MLIPSRRVHVQERMGVDTPRLGEFGLPRRHRFAELVQRHGHRLDDGTFNLHHAAQFNLRRHIDEIAPHALRDEPGSQCLDGLLFLLGHFRREIAACKRQAKAGGKASTAELHLLYAMEVSLTASVIFTIDQSVKSWMGSALKAPSWSMPR
ncbi:hypothetical protein D3C86_1557470 [compost metagenome]